MRRLALLLAWLAPASQAQVTYERLLRASEDPASWLSYSGAFHSQRHTRLTGIGPANVANLRPKWIYQTGQAYKFEASPVVDGSILYVSEPPSGVVALDTRTGRPLWKFRRPLPEDLRLCCGQPNRGVALLGNLVFFNTLDAHVIALDAKTGAVVWDVVSEDYRKGYSMTSAPLAVKDKIVVGMAGGEFGVRGYIEAYEAQTGKRAWRFYTVPGKGEPGSETWAGDSWKTGAGTTWVTGSFDPETNLIYWGTGNPGPDWNGDARAGDNLYTDCVVALDADSGLLKWHFQFTPHDVYDWDSAQVPVLTNGVVRGKPRKLVLWANRNAFYYVLDRTTGEFLSGRSFVKQTWASGLDDKGRPQVNPGMVPSEDGVLIWPGVGGGTNWWSPSYSPATDLFYVAAMERAHIYFKGDNEYKEGSFFNGGGFRDLPRKQRPEEPWGAIRALKPATGELVWEYRIHSNPGAGILTTASGLLFTGTKEGDFIALDARTGKPLWRFQTGAGIGANPIAFSVDGKPHIAIASGTALFVFGLE